MKKIGILTFHRAQNFGASLQAYALQEYLRLMGYNVEIIDYNPYYIANPASLFPTHFIKRDKSFGILILSVIKNTVKNMLALPVRYWRRRKYDRFVKKRFCLSRDKYTTPFDFNREYDVYVIGSDQVWNIEIVQGFDKIYFGDFKVKENAIKISYAASLANYHLTAPQMETFKRLICGNFKHISVREDAAARYLREKFDVYTTVVLDPTLLVRNELLRSISVKPSISGSYVFVYSMGLKAYVLSIARKIAEERGIRVVKQGMYTTPDEFLGLIENAEYVVTSSFHGLTLSLSFSKEFLCVIDKSERFSRQRSLLFLLGLDDRIAEVSSEIQVPKTEIDYAAVCKLLEVQRKHSRTYLERSIEGQKKDSHKNPL